MARFSNVDRFLAAQLAAHIYQANHTRKDNPAPLKEKPSPSPVPTDSGSKWLISLALAIITLSGLLWTAASCCP